MADDRLRCTSPAPEGCNKRFEKTRSRMVYHAFGGPEAPGQPALGPVVSGGRAGRPRDWGDHPNKPHCE